jgi:toxin ParE1/3/4|tara:strand:+ start:820 stop:1110 length:291 start_codon:yes stop_codon:yes gene_type:complete
MLTLIKSPTSEEDLIDIWLYIAEDQPVNADRLLDRLNEAMIKLTEMPKMGVERSELIKGLRSYPLGKYILYYRIKDNDLEVVRVLSSSRDIYSIDW